MRTELDLALTLVGQQIRSYYGAADEIFNEIPSDQ